MTQEVEISFSPEQIEELLDRNAKLTDVLQLRAEKKLHLKSSGKRRCQIVKKSVDARKKDAIRICFRVILSDEPQPMPAQPGLPSVGKIRKRPVVVGFGPGGMMAALLLARQGLCPVVLERGSSLEKRTTEVRRYMTTGTVNPITNVQFGEGGAGTFSDGKLNTGVNDVRRSFVLNTFVQAGAPEEILYLTRPHVGTDRLQHVVLAIRNEIEKLGGTILFERTFLQVEHVCGAVEGVVHADSYHPGNVDRIDTDAVILALGHSARDTFKRLYDDNISFEAKPMSVGVRIEHLQSWLDEAQYGRYARSSALPKSEYKLVAHTTNGRSLYTFCMCPGGFVVPSASDQKEIVTNGMSYYARAGENANSAILVGVSPADYGSDHPLAGISFQEKLERAAFELGGGGGLAPGQTFSDFLKNQTSSAFSSVQPTYRPGISFSNLREILPEYVSEAIAEGVTLMDGKLKGFANPDAFLTGVETRSSSPVRILRDERLESISVRGLYPCGEGAGYAGGIMSSAIDGLRAAEELIRIVNANI